MWRPPRKRLEADAHAARRGAFGELAKVGRGPIDAAKRIRRNVAADHQQIAAELGHDVELALGPREDLGARRLRHPLEIAEGLKRHDRQSAVVDHAAHVAWRPVERQQVVLKNLDALEPGRGDRINFFGQSAAQTDGGDCGLHGALLAARPARRPN
jgi:hypothetical protein